MSCWKTLKIPPTNDQSAIKKAYSRLLKIHKPETDADAYQDLREAYDAAIRYAKSTHRSQSTEHQEAPPSPKPSPKPSSKTEAIHAKTPLRNPVEQTRDTQTNKEPQATKINQDAERANALLQQLIQTNNDFQQLNTNLETIFAADDLINLSIKQIFEIKLFDYLLQAPKEQYYYLLAAKATDFFAWDSHTQHHPHIKGNLNYFLARLDSAKRYHMLKEIAQGKHGKKDKKSIKIAALLTGSLRPRYFKWLLFNGAYNREIKRFLQQLQQHNPLAFELEFNTRTIDWWKENLNRYYPGRGLILLTLLLSPVPAIFIYSAFLEKPLLAESDSSLYIITILPLIMLSLAVNFVILYNTSKFLNRITDNIKPKIMSWLKLKYQYICSYLNGHFLIATIVAALLILTSYSPDVWKPWLFILTILFALAIYKYRVLLYFIHFYIATTAYGTALIVMNRPKNPDGSFSGEPMLFIILYTALGQAILMFMYEYFRTKNIKILHKSFIVLLLYIVLFFILSFISTIILQALGVQ